MLEHSRAVRLAAAAAGVPEHALLQRLLASHIHVDIAAGADNARVACLLVATLRRLPVKISVTGPSASVVRCRAIAAAIDPLIRTATSVSTPPSVTIAVGATTSAADLYVCADRHGARLVTNQGALERPRPASPIGVMFASALAAGEAFKVAAGVVGPRAIRHEHLAFCPVTLTDDPGSAPAIPASHRHGPIAIVGLGAVGTAVAWLLARLPSQAQISLVDPERYAPENRGTYSLGTDADAAHRPWKVDLAAREFDPDLVTTHRGTVAEYLQLIDERSAAWPQTLIAGLDSVAARHDAQRIWPDTLLDAATGDTTCGLHHARRSDSAETSTACMMCIHPARRTTQTSTTRLAELTGLPEALLRRGDQPLTADHVAALDADQRQRLNGLVDKPICALARALIEPTRPRTDCVCQQRARAIQATRQIRANSTGQSHSG